MVTLSVGLSGGDLSVYETTDGAGEEEGGKKGGRKDVTSGRGEG